MGMEAIEKRTAYLKLLGNVEAAVAETAGDMTEDGTGWFNSDKEAWADLKAEIEYAKEDIKHAEQTHKEMWDAVKSMDGNAFNALAQELERTAKNAAVKWAEISAHAKIALESPSAE